jgi:gliding motility-associated-like protein
MKKTRLFGILFVLAISCYVFPSYAQTITTGNLSASSFCAGDDFTIPFTTTGTFNTGNVFTAQLSDASGSFASPVNIGNSTTSPISVTIPIGTPPGAGYLIRIVGSDPITIGSSSIVFTINPPQTILLNFTQTADSVCPGQSVTFTASSSLPLTDTLWTWTVNGQVQIGQNNPVFTLSNITVQSTVVVTLVTNDPCISNPTVQATVNVFLDGENLSVEINTFSNDTICPTQSVTFNAIPNLVLTNATFTWFVNATQVQTGTSASYTTNTLVGLNAVTVVVSSTDPCLNNASATSPAFIILSQAQPIVHNISVFPNTTPCEGTPITFTSVVNPLAPGTQYEWFINGVFQQGEVASTFTTTNYSDGAQVTCVVTNADPCLSGSPQTSNIITITYSTGPAVTVQLSSNVTKICQGNPVSFTTAATNQGLNPDYRWFVNNILVPGAVDSAFNTSNLPPGLTKVSVEITSSEICSTDSIERDSVIIDVTERITPTLEIREIAPFCTKTPGTLNVVNNVPGGTYSWTKDGNTIPFTGAGLVMQDVTTGTVFVATVTNLTGCITTNSATSPPYSVTLHETPTVDAGVDQTIISGRQANLKVKVSPSGNYSYLWAPGTGLSLTNIADPVSRTTDTLTTYIVTVTDLSTRCRNSDTVKIRVELNYEVFIPTAFSPNADGVNDVFYARAANNQIKPDQFTFRIFNEFGELIFESISKEYGWDGTINGEPAMPGVYIYHCFGLFKDEKPFDLNGKFTLMR